MTALLYISLYAAIACFVIGCVRRVRQYASLPVHLRWELYPVPHEPSDRVEHGGSYFEESEWWTKPRHFNYAGELRATLTEILLFKSVRQSNPNLWWRSLLFHSGMYCIVAAGVAYLLARTSSLAALLVPAKALGFIGLVLVIVGALALLWRRLSDRASRDYTHFTDFVHLALIAITGLLLVAATADPAASSITDFLSGALAFDSTLRVSAPLAAGLLLAFALVAYIPYSQMAHFIAKYFTFHTIRWDDAPNHGGRFAKEVER